MVNTNLRDYNATSYDYGVQTEIATANVFIYGGSIITYSNSVASNDLYNGGGFIGVNAAVSYNSLKTTGTISSISGGFGPYNYQKYPNNAPIVLSSNSFAVSNAAADLGQMEVLSTTWNGFDSPFSANYLIYNSIGVLCANSLYTGITGSTSNTFTYNTVVPGCGTGTMTASITISDNSIGQVTNSLTFAVNPMLKSTNWKISNSIIDTGQNQLLTVNISYPNQPDIIVQHSNSMLVYYNATSNTNVAKGVALITVMNSLLSGDSIYLKAETYNINNNAIFLNKTTGLKLYGSGKFQTKIITKGSTTFTKGGMQCGVNTIVADMGLYINQSYSGQYTDILPPFGAFDNANWANCTARNLYVGGYSDGVYLNTEPNTVFANNNVYLYNVTSNTMWDAFNVGGGASYVNKIFVFDSNFTANSVINNPQAETRAIAPSQSNMIIVNSILQAYQRNNTGVESENPSIAFLYGVNIITPGGCTLNATNMAAGNGQIFYNSTTTPPTGGPSCPGAGISPIGSVGYGQYSYQKYPNNPPGGPYGATGTSLYSYNVVIYNAIGSLVYSYTSPYMSAVSNAVSFTQNSAWGAGTFTANVYIEDSATSNSIVSNSLTYTVNTGLAFGFLTESNTVINSGQSSTLKATAFNQPDVLVQYSNGLVIGYNASSISNTIRGNLLLGIAENVVSNENIYLKGEAYDFGGSGIDLSLTGTVTNVNLYGGGQATIIKSSQGLTSGAIIHPSPNSITSDLQISGTANLGTNQAPWGSYLQYAMPNAILRNVVITAHSDGIYYYDNSDPISANVFNVTVNSNWDSATIAGSPSGTLNIFDSRLYSNGAGTFLHAHGIITTSNSIVNAVNDIIIASNGITDTYGIAVDGSSDIVNAYGGSISSSSSSGTVYDLYDQGLGGVLAVNTITSWTTNSGTITSLGSAGFGAYSYQRYPVSPPLYFGGTLPYTINWFASSSCTGTSIGTGSTISVSPASTTSYSFNEVDSASTNSVACSVSNTVTVISSSTTTTIPGSSGSPGGSPGGAPGGGSALPTVIHSGECYLIDNLTTPNSESFALNGTRFNLTVNFISVNDTGITVDGKNYTLLVESSQQLLDNGQYNYSIDLKRISYIPAEHTVNLTVCGFPDFSVPPTTRTPFLINSTYNVTQTPETVSLEGLGSINLSSNSLIQVWLRITNVTNSIVPPPFNRTVLAFNVVAVNAQNALANQTVSLTMRLNYSCSIPSNSVAPYKLSQSAVWTPIKPFSINSTSCSITFQIPTDPIVALFESVAPPITTSVSTTISTTSSTTIPQTQNRGTNYIAIIAIAAVIAVGAIAAYYLHKRRGSGGARAIQAKTLEEFIAKHPVQNATEKNTPPPTQ
ncbi:MAG: hypothetical protein KGH94_01275 [Candidatus Micrarchaeota archaeon]|nr:hypothetical protein [Candidatus Micrarchaeota archaeon]